MGAAVRPAGTPAGVLDAAAQKIESRAPVAQKLAADEIDALDARGPLVDRVEAVVAVELLHVEIARVAVAAMDLYGDVARDQPPFGGPGLRHRRQQAEQQFGLRAPALVLGGVALVHQPCAEEVQRQRALRIALLAYQHTPDIGMGDDRIGGAALSLPATRPCNRCAA